MLIKPEQEDALLLRTSQGDVAAMTDLFMFYWERLLKSIQRHIPADIQAVCQADDVLQEAWIKTRKSMDKLKSVNAGPGLLPLLLTIVHRALLSEIKYYHAAKRHARGWNAISQGAADHASDGHGTDDDPEHEKLVMAMWLELGNLPAKLVDVISLHCLDDRTIAAVAEALGLSTDQVRRMYHQGIELLRLRMGGAAKPALNPLQSQ